MLRIALLILLLGSSALAQRIQIYTDAKGWRLKNYPGNNVVAWYTESVCTAGRLAFDFNATNEDKNRFWSTVMAAKATGKKLFVFYNHDSATGACTIYSFGLREK